MPSRRNPAYAGGFNDPSFAAAASSLGQIFAPPSGTDAAGYANAAATKEKAARLADLYARAQQPGFDPQKADALGVFGGLYNPNQSYYSVNEGNRVATENNQRDNASKVTTTLLAPVAKDATRFVPPSVADLYQIPQMQAGVREYDQGKTYDVPTAEGGAQRVAGPAKPLTEEQLMAQIISGLPQDQQTGLALGGKGVEAVVNPQTGKQELQPRAKAGGMQPVVKADQETEITRLIRERDALPPGDTNRGAYDQRIQALGRGQQQSAYDKAADESFAKLGDEIFTAGKQAVIDQGVYGTILAAVDNPTVDQGTLGSATLGLRKALNAFGINAGNTAPAEMLNALGNQLSLKLRDPSQGQGMPGAMSDADRQFLQSMSVGLGNSPQANKLLAQYYLAAQQRNIDLERLRQEYVAKNGRLDEGFRTQLVQYAQQMDPTKAVRDQISGGNAPPAASGGTQAPVKVASPEEARKLPSGTAILLPDGSTGRVP